MQITDSGQRQGTGILGSKKTSMTEQEGVRSFLEHVYRAKIEGDKDDPIAWTTSKGENFKRTFFRAL